MSLAHIRGLALLLWSADLKNPERVATPFVMAQAAVAMDQAVELYFTAQSVVLLTTPAKDQLVGFGPDRRKMADFLQQLHDLDIPMYACSQALQAEGLTASDLMPQCTGFGGAVQFMSRSIDPAWRTLVF